MNASGFPAGREPRRVEPPLEVMAQTPGGQGGFSTVPESVPQGPTCERTLPTEGSNRVVAGRSSGHLSRRSSRPTGDFGTGDVCAHAGRHCCSGPPMKEKSPDWLLKHRARGLGAGTAARCRTGNPVGTGGGQGMLRAGPASGVTPDKPGGPIARARTWSQSAWNSRLHSAGHWLWDPPPYVLGLNFCI